MSPAALPGAGCRPCHQARGRAHPAAGAQGHRAHRPPAATYDQHDAEGRGVVARQGHALALPQARGASRAAGHAVPRSRRRLGHLRPHPGNSWAEKLLERGLRRLPLRLGRPEAAEADHTLDTYLSGYFVHAVDAVRRIAAADEILLGAYCMGALMAPAAAGQPRRRAGGATSSCSRHPATSSIPRHSSATSATDGCSLRTPSTRRRASCRRAPSAPCSACSNRRPSRAVRDAVGAPVA